MNPDEIRALLKAVASGDRRTTGPEDVHFWAAMAVRGRWTLPEAMAALIEFRHAHPGEWLEPGHLSTIIRAARQDAALRLPAGFADMLPPPNRCPELPAFQYVPPELEAFGESAEPEIRPAPVACDSRHRPRPMRARPRDPDALAAARAELAARQPAPMPGLTTTEETRA